MAPVDYRLRGKGPNYRDVLERVEKLQRKLSGENLGVVLTEEMIKESKNFPVKGKASKQGNKAIFSAKVPANKKKQMEESFNTVREHTKETVRNVIKDSIKRF